MRALLAGGEEQELERRVDVDAAAAAAAGPLPLLPPAARDERTTGLTDARLDLPCPLFELPPPPPLAADARPPWRE